MRGVLRRVGRGEAERLGLWVPVGVAVLVRLPLPPLDTVAVLQGVAVVLALAVGVSLPLFLTLRVARGLADTE